MNSINLEEQIIQKVNRILIIRNACLLILLIVHLSIYMELPTEFKATQNALMVISGITWVYFYLRHTVDMVKTSKNTYLKQAFKDEYFQVIKIKSGYYGFIAMLSATTLIILLALICNLKNCSPLIPIEWILFTGILASDVSKIIMSRR